MTKRKTLLFLINKINFLALSWWRKASEQDPRFIKLKIRSIENILVFKFKTCK